MTQDVLVATQQLRAGGKSDHVGSGKLIDELFFFSSSFPPFLFINVRASAELYVIIIVPFSVSSSSVDSGRRRSLQVQCQQEMRLAQRMGSCTRAVVVVIVSDNV